MKVLIADDSKSMRQMLQGTLEEVGYDVVAAENGQEAWELLRGGNIRLAILDWMMPYMDGLDVCRRLRKENVLSLVHVILLTSREGTENVVAALQAGASDYICKPFHPDELLARLKAGERIVNMQIQFSHMQKMDAIGNLAAGIAHEINTPLQYIDANIRFIRDSFNDIVKLKPFISSTPQEGGDNAEMALNQEEASGMTYLAKEIPRAISDIFDGLERIAKIVVAMKDFSTQGFQKEEIDIRKAIDDVVIVSRNEWKNHAEIAVDYEQGLPPVSCFPADFKLVMLNLIVNATHAIAGSNRKNEEDKGNIVVSAHRDGGWVEIRIRDTGPGIPDEIQNRIYDPFFTTKEVGKGTGMGLTISHSIIVEKHGGTMSFETETGKGTTFIIRLPIGV